MSGAAGPGTVTLDSGLGHQLTNPPYDITGSYEEMEAILGGCDAKYGMGGFVAVLLLLTAMLLLYYVVTFVSDLKRARPREGVCGGKDEGCLCDGNEMLAGGKWPSEVGEDRLSKVVSGM
jgi:hypothetical protein